MTDDRRTTGRIRILLPAVFAAVVLLYVLINVIPPSAVPGNNPYIRQDKEQTMIAAHRGGARNNPENTMMAFRACVEQYGCRIVESDVWLTADNRLVFAHDETVNRMALKPGEEPVVIGTHTLEELRVYNMGYNFADPDSGEYPYRSCTEEEQLSLGLKIPEFHELLEEYYDTHKDLLFIVEIKDRGERGFAAADMIAKTLARQFPDYLHNFVIGTEHHEIETCLKENHPELLRGASERSAAAFILTQLARVNLFNTPDFSCLQIPPHADVGPVTLNLMRKTYIDRAHRRNIAVQYWTINEEADMRLLIDLGTDAIMTDDPRLMRSVLESL